MTLIEKDLPGISFEKAVAAIQTLLDPAASVQHNQLIKDRLGHLRQFDVVVEGTFAWQKMLGVIECKDLRRKVGNPEVDAFITKSSDVNENFKVMISRRGFSKPALEKCAHYGVKALSLITDDPANNAFFIGTYWDADLKYWDNIVVKLYCDNPASTPIKMEANDIEVNGQRVIDWFKNYLLQEGDVPDAVEASVNVSIVFDVPQHVTIRSDSVLLCDAISFTTARRLRKLQRLVGIRGSGFFDWNTKTASFPPNSTISTDAVPMDFSQWEPRKSDQRPSSGFIDYRIFATSVQFENVPNAVPLHSLGKLTHEEEAW